MIATLSVWDVLEVFDDDTYAFLGLIEAEDEEAALSLAAQYYERAKANLVVQHVQEVS